MEVTSDSVFIRGSSDAAIFEHGYKDPAPQPPKLRQESFLDIAAIGMLAVRYGWPLEHLRFQSPDGAFDLLAYADHDWDRSEVAIAGEAKLSQREAVKLSASLNVCLERGEHTEADCTERANHHRKYVGLLKYRPRILWIIGPEAFAADDPDLVFRVEASGGTILRLRRTDASRLTACG